MIMTQMNDKQINKLEGKNKSGSSTHYSGENRLTETVLATP